MKKIILFITIYAATIFPQSAGNSGLSFLKFGFGARNIAMGDVGIAASNDVTSLFYNPANLPKTSETEIMLMHYEWIQDVRSELLGVKFSLFDLPFAVGFNVTTISDIEVRTKPGEAESKFNANYFFGSLSTGFNLIDNLAAGISIKYLYEGIFVDESEGFGFDFGLNYSIPIAAGIEGLSASAVIKNLGSMNELKNEKTKLPAEFRIGPAYRFKLVDAKFDITTAAELQKYLDTDDIHFNIGAEILYDNIIALRAGYLAGYESKTFTGGIGLIWGNLNFDYALSPFALELGSGHSISLSFKF